MPQNLSTLISSITFTGSQGDKGGLVYLFDGDSQASNPGNGDIRFNSGIFASITTVYIDGLTADGADVESYIDTWGDSTNDDIKGHLIIKSNLNTASTYCIFEVTGFTAQSGWTDITVQNPVGSSPVNNEKIVLEFVRAGNKGNTGNTGPIGETGPSSPRSYTIIEPVQNLVVPIFHTLGVTTITNVSSYIGGSSTPSVSFDIKYGTNLTAAGTQTLTAGYTVNNTTGVTSVTSFDNATIPANNVVWAEYTSVTGVVSFTHTSIFY
jgi:hypothetical protein